MFNEPVTYGVVFSSLAVVVTLVLIARHVVGEVEE
jgi:hypothetical protein